MSEAIVLPSPTFGIDTRSSKKRLKKRAKEQEVDNVISEHTHSISQARRREALTSADDALFEIDTLGHLNKRQWQKIKTLQNEKLKSRKELEKEQAWIRARESTEEANKKRKRLEEAIFDLWDSAPPKRCKHTRASSAQLPPAVIVADPGQSINPDPRDWKTFLLAVGAKARPDREDSTIRDETYMPITTELRSIFPSDIIDTLNEYQQMQLFRVAKDSAELLEEPEDFLARVLPTLITHTQSDEDIARAGSATVNSEELMAAEKLKAVKTQPKTRKERNRELRRKEHEETVAAIAREKASRRAFENLGALLRSLEDEEQKKEARANYRKALCEYWEKSRLEGDVRPFYIGKNKYQAPVECVAESKDFTKQQGCLRRLNLQSDPTCLRDRMHSVLRRGLTELPLNLTTDKFYRVKSMLGRVRSRKVKVMKRQSLF